MSNSIDTSSVIEHIYEASYKPEHWPVALEMIAKFTNSNSATLLYKDNELERVSGSYVHNINADDVARFNAYGKSPALQILVKNVPIGTAAAADHLIPNRDKLIELYGDKFYKLTTGMNIYHIAGAVIFMDDIRTSAIGIHRTKSMGIWTKSEIDRLNILIPHLHRAMSIQKEFYRIQVREQALRKGLDKLLMGLILFDKDLHPIYVNPVAESILDYHPAIDMKNGKIYAYEKEHTKNIHSALIAAIYPDDKNNAAIKSTPMGLKHPECATTLPVIISSVQGFQHDFCIADSHAHAVVCFSDPDVSTPIEAELLVDIYGLTLAEAQVSISIANGVTTEAISIINNVALSTTRSHLKSIFRKLGINSQGELIRTLLTGPYGMTQ